MLDKITSGIEPKEIKSFEDAVVLESNSKKRAVKGLLNYGGIMVGIFIMFVVIVVLTTDISITSFVDIAALGLQFFVLLFCSYAMYISCADSGTRAGYNSTIYQESTGTYEALKKTIIDRKIQMRLSEFCRYYVGEELHNTRNRILAEVGISYEVYMKKYIGRDKDSLKHKHNAFDTEEDDENGDGDEEEPLSKTQIKAILKANSISPIHLTPEMIIKRGRGGGGRNPLGVKPEVKKTIHFGTKFLSTLLTSLLLGTMVLNVVAEPSWAMFAAILLKLFAVTLNGFYGYKMGFENIVLDTVHYMADQTDLMEQMMQYVEANPETVKCK